jgi:hypothetical protein
MINFSPSSGCSLFGRDFILKEANIHVALLSPAVKLCIHWFASVVQFCISSFNLDKLGCAICYNQCWGSSCLLSLGLALLFSGEYQSLDIPLLLSLSLQELSLSVPGFGYNLFCLAFLHKGQVYQSGFWLYLCCLLFERSLFRTLFFMLFILPW